MDVLTKDIFPDGIDSIILVLCAKSQKFILRDVFFEINYRMPIS